MKTTPTINVKLQDLPTSISGYVVAGLDDCYTIILNSKLSDDQQREAYNHELRHIENGDFELEDVQKVESQAHGITKPQPEPRPEWVEQRLKKLRKDREKIKQELADYEAEMESVRILWNEKKLLEHQKIGD